MTSPLFRTLQIGSLRYWSEPINVIATYIYHAVGFVLDRRTNNFELNQRRLMFVLTNPCYELNLLKPFEFENISTEVEYDL